MTQRLVENTHYLRNWWRFFVISSQQKWILDAGKLFPSSHVWNDRHSFHRKFYEVKGHFSTKFDFRSFISSEKRNQEI